MDLTNDNAAPANDDARRRELLPRMASALATSPVNLDNPSECFDALVRDYRDTDVNAMLKEAIAQARRIHARAA